MAMNALQKKTFIILEEILVKEITEKTPGSGKHVANAWEIQFEDGEFFLVNTYGLVAKYLDEGVQPHDIFPKTKKMLRFEIKKQPKFRNAKSKKIFEEKGRIFFYNKQGQAVLGFVREGKKIFLFARKVHHPGYEGRKYIDKVLNNEQMWDKIMTEIIK